MGSRNFLKVIQIQARSRTAQTPDGCSSDIAGAFSEGDSGRAPLTVKALDQVRNTFISRFLGA